MNTKILCVDDDENVLTGLQRTLRKQFPIDVAVGGRAGLEKLQQDGPYAVVMADMQMPEMNGIEFLQRAEARWPDTVRLMLTGNADQKTAVDAVNHGHIYRFLTKPCPPEQLVLTLDAGLKHYRLLTAERELLEDTLNGAVKALTDVLAIIDPASFGLGEKLRDYVRTFVQHYKLAELWALELAATLSQIGRVAIPATVLMKVRSGLALQPEEKDMLTRVPRTGAELLANIPRLELVANIVLHQDKHFDGSGFPSDLVAGQDIPVGARILKVLSDLIELEGKGHSRIVGLAQMRSRSGWYDPDVLNSVAECFDVGLPSGPESEADWEELHLKDVCAGRVLVANVVTNDGALIVPAETVVTSILIERLRNFAQLKQLKQPLLMLKTASSRGRLTA